MSLRKRLVATIASGGLLLGAFAAPATAHKVTVESMDLSAWEEDGFEWLDAHMWLSPEDHPGKVMITLKKKNAAGDWVNVATKEAVYKPGWGYHYAFNPVSGDKRCKAKGVFTRANHETLRATSDVIDC